MKNRILLSLLALTVLVTSLTACGEGTSSESGTRSEAQEDTKSVNTDTLDNNDASTPEGSVAELPASEVPVQEEQYPDITDSGLIRNGSWCFTAENNGTTEHYLYNFADKALVRFDLEDGYSVVDACGYSALAMCDQSDIHSASVQGKLIDTKNNSVLFDDSSVYFQYAGEAYAGRSIFFADDTLLVSKYDPSISTEKVGAGLINAAGEWLYPLTFDTPFAGITASDYPQFCDLKNLGSGYARGDYSTNWFYYSLRDNTLNFDSDNYYKERYNDENYMDKLRAAGSDRPSDAKFVYSYPSNEFSNNSLDFSVNLWEAANKYYALDLGACKAYSFELPEFAAEVVDVPGCCDGLLFVDFIGNDGEPYFSAVNTDNEFVFEPIKGESRSVVRVDDIYLITLNSNAFVYDTSANTLTIVEPSAQEVFITLVGGFGNTVVMCEWNERTDSSDYLLADHNDLTK